MCSCGPFQCTALVLFSAFVTLCQFVVALDESVNPPRKHSCDETFFEDTSEVFDSEDADNKEELSREESKIEDLISHESPTSAVVSENTHHLRGHLMKLGKQNAIIYNGVEDLDYIPNGHDFYSHFIRKSRPLVMRGAASEWGAFKYWTNDTYMRKRYGHVMFDVEFTKHYEGIHPIKKTMNLSAYLDIYKTQHIYLDSPFPQSDLTSDVMVPYCLQCEEVMSAITSVHLLYSSGNTSSSLHNDGYQNLLAVISGSKEVLVANSDNAEYLYANNYTTIPGLSPVNPESVDLKKFPNVSKVSFHKVCVRYVHLSFALDANCPLPPFNSFANHTGTSVNNYCSFFPPACIFMAQC